MSGLVRDRRCRGKKRPQRIGIGSELHWALVADQITCEPERTLTVTPDFVGARVEVFEPLKRIVVAVGGRDFRATGSNGAEDHVEILLHPRWEMWATEH